MSYLQKIVVLCVVLGVIGLAFYIGTKQAESPTKDTDSSIPDKETQPDTDKNNLPEVEDEVIVSSFEECVEAGNPVMESFPRKCSANGKTFTETIKDNPNQSSEKINCTEDQKKAEACTLNYAPVCGYQQVMCITTPCEPIPTTYGNACQACSDYGVSQYTQGACKEN